MSQAIPVALPRVPGHEIIGDVVAVGRHERLWKVGQRVGGGWHGGHCSTCTRCRSGDFMTCQNQKINGLSLRLVSVASADKSSAS